jgi:hypothetical protein
MMRDLLLAAVFVAAIVIGSPTPADASPECHASIPNCSIIPGMHDAVPGQPCSSWTKFAYGFDPNGRFMACVSFDEGRSGEWTHSSTIAAGVKEIGSSCCGLEAAYCPTGYGNLGQAPDGRPLQCNVGVGGTTGTWVAPPNGLQG